MQKEEILHNFNAKFEESDTAWLALLPCIHDAKKKYCWYHQKEITRLVYKYVLSQKL